MKYFGVFLFISLALSSKAFAACPVADSTIGEAEATIIGIEYRDDCTYLLLDADLSSTIPNHDDAPFLAGRFKYLGLDPANEEDYKYMFTIATTAMATGIRVYAEITSRTGKVNRLSMSKQSNSIP